MTETFHNIYPHIYASEFEVICNFELLDYNIICAILTVFRLCHAHGYLGGKITWGKLEIEMKVLLIKESEMIWYSWVKLKVKVELSLSTS